MLGPADSSKNPISQSKSNPIRNSLLNSIGKKVRQETHSRHNGTAPNKRESNFDESLKKYEGSHLHKTDKKLGYK